MTKNELLEDTTRILANKNVQKVDDAVLEPLAATSIKTGEINLRGDKIMLHGDIEKAVVVPAVFDKWKQALVDDVVSALDMVDDSNDVEKTMIIGVLKEIVQGGNVLFEADEMVEEFEFDLSEEEKAELIDWVDNNKLEAIKAVLFGYKVEEQLYYVIFPQLFIDRFLNYDELYHDLTIADGEETDEIKTRFTMDFIEEHFPEYKQFAVKVEEADAR